MGKLKEEEIMCKVISVVNQKGGVGKTTTTVNVGIGLAREGKKGTLHQEYIQPTEVRSRYLKM